jgi:hypothetical protein
VKWSQIILWLILGFVFIGVLTHAAGFSQAAGTLFTGTNTLGQTLEGASGSSKKKG